MIKMTCKRITTAYDPLYVAHGTECVIRCSSSFRSVHFNEFGDLLAGLDIMSKRFQINYLFSILLDSIGKIE